MSTRCRLVRVLQINPMSRIWTRQDGMLGQWDQQELKFYSKIYEGSAMGIISGLTRRKTRTWWSKRRRCFDRPDLKQAQRDQIVLCNDKCSSNHVNDFQYIVHDSCTYLCKSKIKPRFAPLMVLQFIAPGRYELQDNWPPIFLLWNLTACSVKYGLDHPIEIGHFTLHKVCAEDSAGRSTA